MNFYAFHIGDYAVHTRHLSLMEDLAYRRLLDLYYTREAPLPSDPAEVARLLGMRDFAGEVSAVLSEFFEPSDSGWIQSRCDAEIVKANEASVRARTNGSKGGRPRAANPGETQPDPTGNPDKSELKAPNPNPNPNPITNPKEKHPAEFELAWSAYPKRPGASKADASKAWAARVKAGADVAAIQAGVERYAAYCQASRTEPQFIKQPATFFGPGEHYLADWAVPPPRQGGKPSTHTGFGQVDYRKGVNDDGSFA